jgi:hypothetical protein
MGCCHPIFSNKDSIDCSRIYLPYVVSKDTVLKGNVFDSFIKPTLQDENTKIERIRSIDSDLAKARTAFNSNLNINKLDNSLSSWNSDSDSDDDDISQINNQEQVDKILDLVNDMRSHPQKYLNRINKFVKGFDYKTNSLKIKDKRGTIHTLKECIEPDYVISYLEKVPSRPNVSKCITDATKTLKIHFFKNLESPLEALFSYLISSKENLDSIYAENADGIVISFKNKIR